MSRPIPPRIDPSAPPPPCPDSSARISHFESVMRDQLARDALPVLLKMYCDPDVDRIEATSEFIASLAYAHADAMVKKRREYL